MTVVTLISKSLLLLAIVTTNNVSAKLRGNHKCRNNKTPNPTQKEN